MQKKESNSSQQSIERALKLLTIMGDSRTAMNVTEISKILNISRSTAYAMLNVMTDMNFLSKDPATGKYFLGYEIFILGSKFRIKYSHLLPCDDYLKGFVKQTTVQLNQVSLTVLQQDYMVLKFLSKILSTAMNQFAEQRIIPAFCTASGKVLLASLSEAEQKNALEHQNLYPYTSSTITDPDKILQQLKEIAAQGYGVDIEEFSNFEINLAAPIKDYSGKTVAAVNLSVPKLIYQNRYQEYIQLAIALGQELSSLLGYWNTF
ncbi:MAG: IclR family transcriptional regulator [Clostridiaceae bacterium]|nr:IclR family transcriptional regulator [Clostridiaceae bacterium]